MFGEPALGDVVELYLDAIDKALDRGRDATIDQRSIARKFAGLHRRQEPPIGGGRPWMAARDVGIQTYSSTYPRAF